MIFADFEGVEGNPVLAILLLMVVAVVVLVVVLWSKPKKR